MPKAAKVMAAVACFFCMMGAREEKETHSVRLPWRKKQRIVRCKIAWLAAAYLGVCDKMPQQADTAGNRAYNGGGFGGVAAAKIRMPM